MHTQEREHIELSEEQREIVLRPLKELAKVAMKLTASAKLDVFDLLLNLFIHTPNAVQLTESFNLINEIIAGRREDTSTVDMPQSHDDRIAKSDEPVDYHNWKQWVGDKIQKLRAEKKWTQEDLAKKSGLPQSHISRIERFKLSPSRRTIERLAKAFGVSVGTLDPTVG